MHCKLAAKCHGMLAAVLRITMCIHQMNQVNSRSDMIMRTAP